VLLALVSALVWSRIAPSDLSLGIAAVPSFWWHLGAVGSLICLTLLCGWVQGLLHWAPADINIDPPAHDPSHGHAIGHH
jgi:hypothetical protein